VYPEAEFIVLVTDNLNTHSPACLRGHFETAEDARLTNHFEWHWHCTPKHCSWLNITKIELNMLSRQYLSRNIPIKKPSSQKWLPRERPQRCKGTNRLAIQNPLCLYQTQATLSCRRSKDFRLAEH
jgi:hypothetical protein